MTAAEVPEPRTEYDGIPWTAPATVAGVQPPTDCPTCTGPTRETTNMVCQTCGYDYADEVYRPLTDPHTDWPQLDHVAATNLAAASPFDDAAQAWKTACDRVAELKAAERSAVAFVTEAEANLCVATEALQQAVAAAWVAKQRLIDRIDEGGGS